jgi:hypothetical protein
MPAAGTRSEDWLVTVTLAETYLRDGHRGDRMKAE